MKIPVNIRIGLCIASMSISAFSNSGAHAASLTSTVRTIQATVSTICDISGGASGVLTEGKLDFGEQVLLSGNSSTVTAATTMVVQCNVPNTTLAVSFGAGNAANPSGVRHLSGPNGSLVAYYLYRDVGGSNAWTDTPQSLVIATDQPTAIPVYGKLPPLSAGIRAGAYTDSVQITIAY